MRFTIQCNSDIRHRLGIILSKMKKQIHNFSITGVIKDDSHLIKAREHYERLLVQQMRDGGYVPILDMSPQFNLIYVEQKNQYGFTLTMFGVFVGKKKAMSIEGFSGQEFLKR
ncbi:MAG: hypothetical protein EB127_00895 [Alphaproteobacteria bacterium]|nr:hypothetical protein [Alphaproteobacteria bacterium]